MMHQQQPLPLIASLLVLLLLLAALPTGSAWDCLQQEQQRESQCLPLVVVTAGFTSGGSVESLECDRVGVVCLFANESSLLVSVQADPTEYTLLEVRVDGSALTDAVGALGRQQVYHSMGLPPCSYRLAVEATVGVLPPPRTTYLPESLVQWKAHAVQVGTCQPNPELGVQLNHTCRCDNTTKREDSSDFDIPITFLPTESPTMAPDPIIPQGRSDEFTSRILLHGRTTIPLKNGQPPIGIVDLQRIGQAAQVALDALYTSICDPQQRSIDAVVATLQDHSVHMTPFVTQFTLSLMVVGQCLQCGPSTIVLQDASQSFDPAIDTSICSSTTSVKALRLPYPEELQTELQAEITQLMEQGDLILGDLTLTKVRQGISTTTDPLFLSAETGITVQLGATSLQSEGHFLNVDPAVSLANIINLPTANDAETHNQETHIWWSLPVLELEFDLGADYDLCQLLVWNYMWEDDKLDQVDWTFRDAAQNIVGQVTITPSVGVNKYGYATNNVVAETFDLDPSIAAVRFVTAVLGNNNDEGPLDFLNLGFNTCGDGSDDTVG